MLPALLACALQTQLIAYDEFDGRKAGFAEDWKEGKVEAGKWVTVSGNSWRALEHPVTRATVWFAVTMRMRDSIQGYASVVPAASGSSQLSELGFNTGFGGQTGLWTNGPGLVRTPYECTKQQTFLQRFDLADGAWSGWSLSGDGSSGIDASGRLQADPLVRNAPLRVDTISHLFLTKGSGQELEIERVAFATTAKAALTPSDGPVGQVKPGPTAPIPPGMAKLQKAAALRSGDRIAFFGDSITWQGGYIDLLEKALSGRHVALLRRGINGAKSGDVLKGVKGLFGQNQDSLQEVIARDKPTAAVIMVGINDVWNATAKDTPASYRAHLEAIAKACNRARVKLVLCSPTIIGEDLKTVESKRLGAALDGLSGIARSVAVQSGATWVDTRTACLRHLAGPEASTRLTYDGVHMTDAGNALLADCIGAGLARAFTSFDPAPRFALVPPVKEEKWARGSVGLATLTIVGGAFKAQVQALESGLSLIKRAPGQARLTFVRAPQLAKEGYRINIAPGEVRVAAGSAYGAASACSTLLQLAVVNCGSWPCGSIADAPEVPYRGLLLDVARQWHSVTSIKQVITLCWLYKINYLQLHLTDDQSFTFPSESLPALPTPGRSYTKGELRSLVEFGRARGVTIIPEIEMPGHGAQFVSKMPEPFRAHEKHHATLNFAKREVRDALKRLLLEVMEVFDSPYIHIGGDEADLTYVGENSDFQAAMRIGGFENPQELFRNFLNDMNEVVRSKGRTMLAWEGFSPEGKTPISKDIIVQNFESAYYPPDRMAEAGITMINASWKPLYVVNDRNWTPAEIYAWNHRRWDHFVEGFPSFKGIQLGPDSRVLGAMMCAWEQPESREIPSLRGRLPALAERLWAASRRGSYEDFLRRWKATDAILESLLNEAGTFAPGSRY